MPQGWDAGWEGPLGVAGGRRTQVPGRKTKQRGDSWQADGSVHITALSPPPPFAVGDNPRVAPLTGSWVDPLAHLPCCL